MSARMSKPTCAEARCTEDHTLMSKFCLSHIHSNTEEGSLVSAPVVETQKTSAKGSRKKAAPKRKSTPSKRKATPAQRTAAKAASAFPQIKWEDEVRAFKKSADRELSIELGSPGSAQVTRVRLTRAPYSKGLKIETCGSNINFFKKGR